MPTLVKLTGDLELDARNYQKGLKQQEKNTENFGKKVIGINDRVAFALRTVGFTMAAAGAKMLAQESLNVAGTMDGLRRAIAATAGDTRNLEQHFQRLNEMAKLPGLGKQEAYESVTRLAAVGVSLDEAERAVKSFANAAVASGGGINEMSHAMLGFSQMLTKGGFMAQDFRQIIEPIPLIAKAIKDRFGTLDYDLLRQVPMDELKEAFLSAGETIPPITDTLTNTMENLGESFQNLKEELGNTLAPTFKIIAESISNFNDFLKDTSPSAKKAVVGISAVGLGITGLSLALLTFREGIVSLRFFLDMLDRNSMAQQNFAAAAGAGRTAINAETASIKQEQISLNRLDNALAENVKSENAAANAARRHRKQVDYVTEAIERNILMTRQQNGFTMTHAGVPVPGAVPPLRGETPQKPLRDTTRLTAGLMGASVIAGLAASVTDIQDKEGEANKTLVTIHKTLVGIEYALIGGTVVSGFMGAAKMFRTLSTKLAPAGDFLKLAGKTFARTGRARELNAIRDEIKSLRFIARGAMKRGDIAKALEVAEVRRGAFVRGSELAGESLLTGSTATLAAKLGPVAAAIAPYVIPVVIGAIGGVAIGATWQYFRNKKRDKETEEKALKESAAFYAAGGTRDQYKNGIMQRLAGKTAADQLKVIDGNLENLNVLTKKIAEETAKTSNQSEIMALAMRQAQINMLAGDLNDIRKNVQAIQEQQEAAARRQLAEKENARNQYDTDVQTAVFYKQLDKETGDLYMNLNAIQGRYEKQMAELAQKAAEQGFAPGEMSPAMKTAEQQYKLDMWNTYNDYRDNQAKKEADRQRENLQRESEYYQERLNMLRDWASQCKTIYEDYSASVIAAAKEAGDKLNEKASMGQLANRSMAKVSVLGNEFLTAEQLKQGKEKVDRERFVEEYNKKAASQYLFGNREQGIDYIVKSIDRLNETLNDRRDERYEKENHDALQNMYNSMREFAQQTYTQKSVVKI